MKKALKAVLITLIVLAAAVGSLAFWQRENIKSIMAGINESEEEIAVKREENQTKLVEEINTYLDEALRSPTQEEEKMLKEGVIELPELYSKIFDENLKKLEDERVKKQKEKQKQKDEIVSKYMSKLYSYQSEFESRAETAIAQGARYYEDLKKTQSKASARANTITHFTPIVNGIESECDARVEAVLSSLKKELEGIGAQTDILGTIREMYKNEKQLKLSYYSNKYLK